VNVARAALQCGWDDKSMKCCCEGSSALCDYLSGKQHCCCDGGAGCGAVVIPLWLQGCICCADR